MNSPPGIWDTSVFKPYSSSFLLYQYLMSSWETEDLLNSCKRTLVVYWVYGWYENWQFTLWQTSSVFDFSTTAATWLRKSRTAMYITDHRAFWKVLSSIPNLVDRTATRHCFLRFSECIKACQPVQYGRSGLSVSYTLFSRSFFNSNMYSQVLILKGSSFGEFSHLY